MLDEQLSVDYLNDVVEPFLTTSGWEISTFDPVVTSSEDHSTFFNRLIAFHKTYKLLLCLTCGVSKDTIDREQSNRWDWQFAFCPEESFDRWANSRHIIKNFFFHPPVDEMVNMVNIAVRVRKSFKLPEEIDYVEL